MLFNLFQGLSAIEELQVLELLMVYFSKQENEEVCHAVFHVLFGHLLPARCQVLCHAVSMAVSLSNERFLDSAAIWMQV